MVIQCGIPILKQRLYAAFNCILYWNPIRTNTIKVQKNVLIAFPFFGFRASSLATSSLQFTCYYYLWICISSTGIWTNPSTADDTECTQKEQESWLIVTTLEVFTCILCWANYTVAFLCLYKWKVSLWGGKKYKQTENVIKLAHLTVHPSCQRINQTW